MLNRNYHKPTICLCVSHVSDLKDEVKEKAIKLLSPDKYNIIQDINVNGNDVTIVNTTPVGAVEFKAALGEESMQSAVDGSPLKVVIISKTFVFRLSMLDILNHISLQVHQTPYLPTCLVSNVLLKMCVCVCVCLPASVCLSARVCLSVCLSVRACVRASVCLSVCLSVRACVRYVTLVFPHLHHCW
jgi:hypothetical protein